jgi:SAM-dependent methyltransferase
MTRKHLDIGCGSSPRNPYQMDRVFGCDIRPLQGLESTHGFTYQQANLAMEPVPYADNFFDSVSAFDFLEHMPRQMATASGQLRNPFIDLMNEIHRILKPGGVFLAVTPAYPHPAVFSDPTHVNFITARTHEYFVGERPAGAIYGFTGRFDLITARWDTPANTYQASIAPWRQSLRRLQRRLLGGGLSHQRWELRAVKPHS